jgi:hypothetical protein
MREWLLVSCTGERRPARVAAAPVGGGAEPIDRAIYNYSWPYGG